MCQNGGTLPPVKSARRTASEVHLQADFQIEKSELTRNRVERGCTGARVTYTPSISFGITSVEMWTFPGSPPPLADGGLLGASGGAGYGPAGRVPLQIPSTVLSSGRVQKSLPPMYFVPAAFSVLGE
jgi:hypothetical protein